MPESTFKAGAGLYIEHRTNRKEGPKVYYVVRSGLSSRLFTDKTALIKWVKWPKSTPSGVLLREWLDEWELADNPVAATTEVPT